MDFLHTTQIRSAALNESIRISMRSHVDAKMFDASVFTFSSFIDPATRNWVAQFDASVRGTQVRVETESTCHVPSDWWQHFKQRWFPQWLRRRYPVATREIATIKRVCHFCQHAQMAQVHHINFLTPTPSNE